jgi:hypothetical protein
MVFIKKERNILMQDTRIKINENTLEYKKGFQWHALPYSDIIQAYLRVEEVQGRLCCGVANFDMYFLMLKTRQDDLIKVEASSQEITKQMLEELKQKNPEIEIGYKRA